MRFLTKVALASAAWGAIANYRKKHSQSDSDTARAQRRNRAEQRYGAEEADEVPLAAQSDFNISDPRAGQTLPETVWATATQVHDDRYRSFDANVKVIKVNDRILQVDERSRQIVGVLN